MVYFVSVCLFISCAAVFQWLRTEKGRSVLERLGMTMQTPLNLTVLGIPLTFAAATGLLGDMNPLYYFLIIFPIRNFVEWTVQWMALGLMYQMGRWALTLAALGLGHRFLNFINPTLRYASEAAMPFYLLHMTLSVVTGYFVIQLNAPVAVKYPLIVVVATGLKLLAYELVRRWNVTRWLFGMKPAKKDMPVSSMTIAQHKTDPMRSHLSK